ncbi:ATP-binding cassette domain-containing protein [Peptoniphilus equinus]|uniref:ATP-binding cassette domain-containing protein n=1 Tax=Peptoniphilus equinus TaxID=3016343 RepID=A0ABY7QRD3_9FIRM|nr:ATP-binding cassette domain-containing protein [Peptoniphilus equinus]WBW49356.1 ATP-binding cassette domain-containing protein [Peptoniphilus equinus]
MFSIDIQGVSFGYTKALVLKDVNLQVQPSEMVAIHGGNGSGKSTLLKLLLGHLRPQRGQIKLLGQDSTAIKDFRDVGYVPQVQTFNDMGFPITTCEMVALNLLHSFGRIKVPRRRHYEKAGAMLRAMGMDRYETTPYNELSGGLKQRTMIARALINKPKLLILDEPTAGVDKASKESFLKLINTANAEDHITVIIVTHDMELVRRHLNLTSSYHMEDGRLKIC